MRKFTVAALCSASFLAFPAVAHAQTVDSDTDDFVTSEPATEESDSVGSPIIVTARRRDEDVQEVPAVVNAVSAEDIAQLNLRDFEEVEGIVPGLQLGTNANGIGGNASIRGINFDINVSGNNPSVEFYFNDAPITAGLVLQQMFDVGQIEVLRGPQGTLRGRASPSGAITVTSRKPDLYEIGGYASMTGNDIGGINFNGALGIPIIEGVAAIRVAGVWAEDDFNEVRTIADPVLDGRDPHQKSQSGRISAVLEPTDWLRLEGMYQKTKRDLRYFQQYECGNIANPSLADCPVALTADDRASIVETPWNIAQEFDIFTWNASLKAAGQELIYVGSYRKQQLDSIQNDDYANFFTGFDFFQTTDTRSYDESHEIRLQNEERVFGMLDYVIGYFHQSNKPPTDLTRQTPVAFPPFIPSPPFPSFLAPLAGTVATVVETPIQRVGNSSEDSYFGNITLHIGDNFEISGGLRYIEISGDSQLIVAGNTIVDNPTDEDKLIYSGSINYFFNPDVMVYASTGTSYRSGPTAIGDFSLIQSPLQQSFISLPPEESTSYEVGLKSTLMDGRMRFNITGFYQDFKNYPYRATDGVFYQSYGFGGFDPNTGAPIFVPGVENFNFVAAVPVEVYGVETELGFEITPNWDLAINAAYSKGEIKDGLIPCNDLDGDGIPDQLTTTPTLAEVQAAYGADNLGGCNVTQRSSFQPLFTATAVSEYNFPISDSTDAYLRGLVTYNGSSKNDPTRDLDDVGSYALVNLYTGIRDPEGRWEVSLFAKNLFDTTKVLSRNSLATTEYQQLTLASGLQGAEGLTYTSPYRIITTTPPREFGLNVRFAFGSR